MACVRCQVNGLQRDHQNNERAGTPITPIRLTFNEEEENNKGKDNNKGPGEEKGEDLKKPYKEVLKSPFTKKRKRKKKSPFTRRIIEFSAPNHRMPTNLKIYDGYTDPDDHITRFMGAGNQGEWEMPVRCKMFRQTLDGPARGWFDRMPNSCIHNRTDLRERFAERFALRRKCSRDLTEVSKIIQRANETLPDFKEHWTEEMSYIQGVPEVMRISSFMSNSKCPELARCFADQVPQTVTEMMKRVDDFVKSEEAYKNTLPKGEHLVKGKGTSYKGTGHLARVMVADTKGWNTTIPTVLGTTISHMFLHGHTTGAIEGDTGHRALTLATSVPLMVGTPKKENLDKFYDYQEEKGHYTNDCYQLKRKVDAALESGKLSYLVKDVRQQ
ncbi:hypothetical protein Tco_0491954 [Tanacetum coccineum]